MPKLFYRRIDWRVTGLSFILLQLISFTQFTQSASQIASRQGIFHDSPYTSWLSMDQFNFSPILFFLVVPLLAAIPGASLITRDIKEHFVRQLILRLGGLQVAMGYMMTSFMLGAALVGSTLLVNFAAFFLVLPNNQPDILLNVNIAVMAQDTLWVSLYYGHPFWHALFSILIASGWSGLFAAFATGMGWFIRNHFVAVTTGLLLQVGLMVLNIIMPTPRQISYIPFDFMRESAGANVDGKVVLSLTLIVSLIVILLTVIGGKHRAYEASN